MTDGIDTMKLLRLVGIMAIGVGVAWALQVVGLGGSSASGRLLWIVAAAMIAGAGAGLVFTATSAGGPAGSARA